MPLLLARATAVRVAAHLSATEHLGSGGAGEGDSGGGSGSSMCCGFSGDLLSPFGGFDAQLECLLLLLGSPAAGGGAHGMGTTQLRQRALNALGVVVDSDPVPLMRLPRLQETVRRHHRTALLYWLLQLSAFASILVFRFPVFMCSYLYLRLYALRAQVRARFRDEAISVREAAVKLVGQYIVTLMHVGNSVAAGNVAGASALTRRFEDDVGQSASGSGSTSAPTDAEVVAKCVR